MLKHESVQCFAEIRLGLPSALCSRPTSTVPSLALRTQATVLPRRSRTAFSGASKRA